MALQGTLGGHPDHSWHRPRILVPVSLLREVQALQRLAGLLGGLSSPLADRHAAHVRVLYKRRPLGAWPEAVRGGKLAPGDGEMDAHRKIRFPFRRSGLGRQIDVRRFALAPLLAKLVQAANPFLAVRWLGGS